VFLGVKHFLLLSEPVDTLLKEFRRLALVQLQPAGVARIMVLELKARTSGDTERANVVLDAVEDLLSGHTAASL
jgi:hypothetical protein